TAARPRPLGVADLHGRLAAAPDARAPRLRLGARQRRGDRVDPAPRGDEAARQCAADRPQPAGDGSPDRSTPEERGEADGADAQERAAPVELRLVRRRSHTRLTVAPSRLRISEIAKNPPE